jgi:hypothetical protein
MMMHGTMNVKNMILKILSLRKEVPKAHNGMRRIRYCPLGARTGLGVTPCFLSISGTYAHLFLTLGGICPTHLITVTFFFLLIFGKPTNYEDYYHIFSLPLSLSLSFNFQLKHPPCVARSYKI